VGPDAGVDSDKFGPMGFDEFNVAREAGNFGWPFVLGKNQPYNRYDYETGTYMGPFDPKALVNDSPNNTGLRELPPAQPALIAYPYKVSDEWPILGSAARSAVGGPVFRRTDFAPDAPGVFPDYYEGKWLVTDYVRNWIMVVTMNEERTQVKSIERFLPPEHLSHKQPLDMDFGPSGDLYIVEYGSGGQGRLSKITYNAGNRVPVALAGAEPSTGAVPLQVSLSSSGSIDFDGDDLNYTWVIKPIAGGETQKYTQQNPLATIQQPGRYDIVLTVSDPAGATDSVSFEMVAGNERPDVNFEITSGNRSFYFPNKTIGYKVQVNDHEDGSLPDGGIASGEVSVTAEYIPSGMTFEQLTVLRNEGEIGPGMLLRHLKAKALITRNNCVTCHKVDAPLVGPSFMDVAQKYKEEEDVFENLTKSIVEGSSGKWSHTAMPPHPMLTQAETKQIITYILDLAASEDGKQSLSVEGDFQTVAHEAHEAQEGGGRLSSFFSPSFELGSYVLHASYTDKGSGEVPGLKLTGDDVVLLRYPLLAPETADVFSENGISFTPSTNDPGFIFTGQGGYVGFRNIDLTGINRINIGAITRFWHWTHFVGATVELRLGSPTGRLIGESYKRIPPASSEGDGPFFGDAGGKPIPVDVSEVNGIHDVYIVIYNSDAGKNDALIIMTGIEFEQ
jgi:cytochrome c